MTHKDFNIIASRILRNFEKIDDPHDRAWLLNKLNRMNEDKPPREAMEK